MPGDNEDHTAPNTRARTLSTPNSSSDNPREELSSSATGTTYLVVRHGLLALATGAFLANTLMFTILTLHPTDWYFAPTAIFVALVVGLTVFGVRVATDRPSLKAR